MTRWPSSPEPPASIRAAHLGRTPIIVLIALANARQRRLLKFTFYMRLAAPQDYNDVMLAVIGSLLRLPWNIC